MTQFHLFAQRIGLIGLTQLIVGLQGLILLPIFTKNLSIENYGIWAQIVVTIGIVPQLALFGLPFTMVRYIPALKYKDDLQETFYSIFSIVLLSTILTSTILYTFSEQIAYYLFEGDLFVTQILTIIVFFECMILFFLNYLRAKQYIKKYSSIMLIKTFLMIIIVGFFVLNGYGITGAVYGLLTVNLILFLILIILVYNDVGFKFPQFHNLKEFLGFGIPTLPSNLSSWIVNSSDRYVIGILCGASSVGYYSPGYSIGGIMSMFIAPLSFLLPSILSENYDKKQIENVKHILSYSFKYFMIITIPTTFGISILSKPLLTVLSTPEIAEKGFLITPFVAASMLLFGAYTILFQIIVLEKQTYVIGRIWIIAAIINLVLNFSLIPYIGIVAAAFTTLIAFGFSFLLTIRHSQQILQFNMNPQIILKSILSSSVMSIPIIIYEPTGWHKILLLIFFCATIYISLMYTLKTFQDEEISFFKSLLRH